MENIFLTRKKNKNVIEMRNIYKRFPGVLALNNVSIAIKRGEVRAIVGENGAGKSTLIKILSRVYIEDDGEIWLDGKITVYRNPIEALQLGILTIYQEFNLIKELSVAKNIMLGRIPTSKWKLVDFLTLQEKARKIIHQLGFQLDTEELVGNLNIAQQQIVEIAKSLAWDAKILIMDEPTSALNKEEINCLFKIIKLLVKKGVTIIYISHRLSEVFQIANSVTVLKDGNLIKTSNIKDITREDLIRMMIGRKIKEYYPPKAIPKKRRIFRVENLGVESKLRNISFFINAGEILGVAGLQGQGQQELVRSIFGTIKKDCGNIYIDEKLVNINSPFSAIDNGIGFIPDDRKLEGLFLIRPVNENISIININKFRRGFFFIDKKLESKYVLKLVDKLKINLSNIFQTVKYLSGGNQQKVVLGKWLKTNLKVLIVSEPTRGIDVGSKSEIYYILRELANNGMGILMISNELPEIIGMSNRILIISKGQIVKTISGKNANEEKIMSAATMEDKRE